MGGCNRSNTSIQWPISWDVKLRSEALSIRLCWFMFHERKKENLRSLKLKILFLMAQTHKTFQRFVLEVTKLWLTFSKKDLTKKHTYS